MVLDTDHAEDTDQMKGSDSRNTQSDAALAKKGQSHRVAEGEITIEMLAALPWRKSTHRQGRSAVVDCQPSQFT